ncbi:ABC transporter substrate-binding protein [Sporomusa acidovorans]|uniref:Leucine-, isoleucine-, valine-, threonine-, and alanine-binding protein n=1 Tax=Sporomusa acidovorans (strain ATCC 49682 / DSM 3132 / Mol) TaxID=1123286 RepID=A0ABZ3JA88_SPOA4|nr:ABC transporter substrate-binding protein [Sporomusa acidovorans]OZC13341.1 leucine-, isoleucine-, valine-, threonine-, and alanine-binding protein precursor [Sporomusa acidovorans DSM 3132]SDD95831.1 amino acid/amide ABC transporter substrate-binding protein, HAAT family [Sporomusa acidovorans]
MRKYVKTVSVFVAVLMLSILLAGCGGSSTSSNSNASQKLKIGVVYELTGNTASYGKTSMNGAELAFKEINANGGVLGKQIELVVADNKGEPSEAANAMTKLITQDKVVAVTGFSVSSCGIAGGAVAEANKIPLVAASTTNPRVTLNESTGKAKDWVFRACFIDPLQGKVAANFALNTLKAKNVVILTDSSADYSKGLTQVFEESFTQGGGAIIAKEAFLQKDQDFKSILTKVKAANPDMVYLPAYYEEVGKLIKQARELGITAPFLGGDGWDSPKLIELAGPEALNHTYITNSFTVEDTSPRCKSFVEAYQKAYGILPDSTAVLAYDAAYILVDAIKRANSTDPEKIRQALAATKDIELATGKLSIDENHNAVKSVVILEYVNGKQTFKERINP